MDIAKIFINGRSQAVRLPKDYRFEGSEVYVPLHMEKYVLTLKLADNLSAHMIY